MTDAERLDFLAGQVHALMGFAQAVISTHHAPERLARHLDSIGQMALARAEGTLVSDDYVDGVQDVQNRLKRGVEIALGQREARNSTDRSG